jgi:hypothetical protein
MVVDNFNVESISGAPTEANSPLIVDPDRVLPCSIAFQFLQPIAGDAAKLVKPAGRMNCHELLQCAALHIARNPPTGSTGEKLRRFP